MNQGSQTDRMRVLKHIRTCAIVTAVSSAVIACVLIGPIVQSLVIGVVVTVKRWPGISGLIVALIVLILLQTMVSRRSGAQRREASEDEQ